MTIILDSEAFSGLARSKDGLNPGALILMLRTALQEDADVVVPAAVLAEQYRGGHHDQVVDSCLGRYTGIEVIDTDRALARVAGNLLARAGLGSEHHVDATVAAAALMCGGGLIVTSDHGDIETLTADLPQIAIEQI